MNAMEKFKKATKAKPIGLELPEPACDPDIGIAGRKDRYEAKLSQPIRTLRP